MHMKIHNDIIIIFKDTAMIFTWGDRGNMDNSNLYSNKKK